MQLKYTLGVYICIFFIVVNNFPIILKHIYIFCMYTSIIWSVYQTVGLYEVFDFKTETLDFNIMKF